MEHIRNIEGGPECRIERQLLIDVFESAEVKCESWICRSWKTRLAMCGRY